MIFSQKILGCVNRKLFGDGLRGPFFFESQRPDSPYDVCHRLFEPDVRGTPAHRLFFVAVQLIGCLAVGGDLNQDAEKRGEDFLVLPNSTNAVQFRLYTNSAPSAPHLFNTFEIQAYGETLLKSPTGDLDYWLRTSSSNVFLHNVLVNGTGPQVDPSNSMTVLAQASETHG